MLNMSKISNNRTVVLLYLCFTPFDDMDYFEIHGDVFLDVSTV